MSQNWCPQNTNLFQRGNSSFSNSFDRWSEIKKGEVASSDCLLEQLYELSDVYRDDEGNMDEIIIDAGLIDEDIPEWTPLRTAICKFHSKFNLIEEDFSGYFNGVDIGGIIEIRYDSDDSDEDDESSVRGPYKP